MGLALLGPAVVEAAPGTSVAPAATQPLASALEIEPGATCLDTSTLVADLASWRDEPSLDARVRVVVRGDPELVQALTFTVWIGDRQVVVREFDAAPARCEDLHAVVGLAIAIALDDSLAPELGIVDTPAEPVAQIEAGEGDLPRWELEPKPEPARRSGPALALTPLALVSAGLTPNLTGGAGLSFDIRPRDHFDVRLGALFVHQANIPLAAGRAGMSVAAGRVDLCWGTAPLAVRLRLCAGAAGGATIAAARGQAMARTGALPWFAGIADVDVAVHVIGPLALEFRVEGVFPFQQTRFDATGDAGQVIDSIEPELAALLVSIGPRFEF